MPLVDHFHAPLAPRHAWESFHSLWCGAILAELNRVLPPRFFGQVHVHLGPEVEADVAEHDTGVFETLQGNGAKGGVALAAWAPPAATVTVEVVFPDDIEVQVYDTREGAILVGVIELVSPANKDRPAKREAFAAKCHAYLQRGIGLVIADVVTGRHFNLHNEMMGFLKQPAARMADGASLYATAYRPQRRGERNEVDIWMLPLVVGEALPTLPLALRGVGCVPVDLEASYTAARELSRI
jgi:hypothetical protein